MSDRDKLAGLLASTYTANGVDAYELAQMAADAILTHWQLVPVGPDPAALKAWAESRQR